jgi:hypothetical protein
MYIVKDKWMCYYIVESIKKQEKSKKNLIKLDKNMDSWLNS